MDDTDDVDSKSVTRRVESQGEERSINGGADKLTIKGSSNGRWYSNTESGGLRNVDFLVLSAAIVRPSSASPSLSDKYPIHVFAGDR